MDLQELSRFNTWWTSGHVRDVLLEKYQRKLYSNLRKNLEKRQIFLVWGLRRVGKTVLVYQLIDDLLRTGTNPESIIYFSFDEAPADLNDVLETYQKQVLNSTLEATTEKIFVFFDEIQKVKDWESKIKVYYDLYPLVKFVLTGSASVALRKRSKESLGGRIVDYPLEPLSFEEFLELSGKDIEAIKKDPKLWEREVMPLFYKYMKYGSFPELVHETDEIYAQNYIQSNVIERVVYKDIPQEFGLKDVDLLKSLIYTIAKNPGSIINYRELSKDLARDQRTISNYVEYLEYGLLVKLIYNYRGSPLASARKMKKAYLTTPNLTFAFGEPNSTTILPKLLENLVLMKTRARFFFRNSFEVDFVLVGDHGGGNKLTGIEVKKGRTDARQLRLFSRHFAGRVKGTILLTLERETTNEFVSIPLWEFLLTGID